MMDDLQIKRQSIFAKHPYLPVRYNQMILTEDEKQRLDVVRNHLIGEKVRINEEAFNRSDKIVEIVDIVIVYHNHTGMRPCAILDFSPYGNSTPYILRSLRDIHEVNHLLEQVMPGNQEILELTG